MRKISKTFIVSFIFLGIALSFINFLATPLEADIWQWGTVTHDEMRPPDPEDPAYMGGFDWCIGTPSNCCYIL